MPHRPKRRQPHPTVPALAPLETPCGNLGVQPHAGATNRAPAQLADFRHRPPALGVQFLKRGQPGLLGYLLPD